MSFFTINDKGYYNRFVNLFQGFIWEILTLSKYYFKAELLKQTSAVLSVYSVKFFRFGCYFFVAQTGNAGVSAAM